VVRDGADTSMALRIDNDAVFVTTEAARHTPFARTAWGISRSVAVDPGTPVRLLRTLENGPFYARSLVAMNVHGRPALAVHESLSLDRFASPLVQAMLPFKMPRVGRSAPTALRRAEPE
jgi:carotenoid 1,2-hydratase